MTRHLAAPGRYGTIAVAFVLIAGCGGGAAGTSSSTTPTPPAAVAPSTAPIATTSSAPTTDPSPTAALPLAHLDGWIAYSIGDSRHADIRLVRPDGTDNHVVAQDAGPRSNHPEWLADGRSFLFEQVVGRNDVRSIWSWDMATNVSTELVPCADPCVSRQGPAPSADGSRIAYETNDGPIDDVAVGTGVAQIPAHCGLQVMTVATRATEDLASGPCGIVEWRAPRWSPDGRLAYFRTHQASRGGPVDLTELIVRDLTTGKESVIHDWPTFDDANQLEWSPDGAWIAFTTLGRLDRIHPDGSGTETLLEDGDAATHATPYHPRFLDDGRSISVNWSISPRGFITSVKLYVMPADGGAPREVLPEGPNGTELHYNWGSLQPTP